MFSIGFKPGDLSAKEMRGQRTFRIQVTCKQLLQPLMFDVNPHLKKIFGYQKQYYVLQKYLSTRRIAFKSTWSKCATSWIRLDVNDDVPFCNLLKGHRRVLSSRKDNFLGRPLLFWRPFLDAHMRLLVKETRVLTPECQPSFSL